eukprot:scaffold24644_cov63-Phaeocystis_antarctica.AAC.4
MSLISHRPSTSALSSSDSVPIGKAPESMAAASDMATATPMLKLCEKPLMGRKKVPSPAATSSREQPRRSLPKASATPPAGWGPPGPPEPPAAVDAAKSNLPAHPLGRPQLAAAAFYSDPVAAVLLLTHRRTVGHIDRHAARAQCLQRLGRRAVPGVRGCVRGCVRGTWRALRVRCVCGACAVRVRCVCGAACRPRARAVADADATAAGSTRLVHKVAASNTNGCSPKYTWMQPQMHSLECTGLQPRVRLQCAPPRRAAGTYRRTRRCGRAARPAPPPCAAATARCANA